jgi:hypothetical protein
VREDLIIIIIIPWGSLTPVGQVFLYLYFLAYHTVCWLFYSGLLKVVFSRMQATIGIDFLSKTMYLEDRTVRLQLWYGDYYCIHSLFAP